MMTQAMSSLVILAQATAPAAGFDLQSEIEGFTSLFSGVGIFEALTIVTVGILAAAGIKALTMWLRRVGLDPHNIYSRVSTVGAIIAFLVAFDFLLLWMLERSALATLILLLTTALVVGFSAMGLMQNLLAGMVIALKGRLYPGVYVTIDGHEGIVERVGPMVLRLRTHGGAVVHIPNRRFRAEAYAIRPPERTAHVSLRFTLAEPASSVDCMQARQAAILCPYRFYGSDVAVQIQGERQDVLEIDFEAPSESFAAMARQFMRRALEARLRA